MTKAQKTARTNKAKKFLGTVLAIAVGGALVSRVDNLFEWAKMKFAEIKG